MNQQGEFYERLKKTALDAKAEGVSVDTIIFSLLELASEFRVARQSARS